MEVVLDVLKFLSCPFENDLGNSIPASSVDLLLTGLTEKCVAKMRQSGYLYNHIIENDEASTTWKFVCIVLETLIHLKDRVEEHEATQTEEEKSVEVLSLQAQLDIQNCLELVVGFGLLPYLLPGLGVPENLRKLHKKAGLFIQQDKLIPDLQKFFRLSHSIEIILRLCKHPSLKTLIVPKHVTDIVAAYLQLCKSPVRNPSVGTPTSKELGLSTVEYDDVMSRRITLSVLFEQIIFSSVSKVTLVNSLLILGATPKPRWIGKSCRDMTCDLLLTSDNGLAVISQAVLNTLGQANMWKGARVTTNILREAVQSNRQETVENTVANLCSQVYDIVQTIYTVSEAAQDSQEQLKLVVMCTGVTLTSICRPVAWDNLWYRLFSPLLEIRTKLAKGGEKMMISADDVDTCIAYADNLLATEPALDCPFPLIIFLPIWSLLFQIFAMTDGYLKRKVQEPSIVEVAENLRCRLENTLTSALATCLSVSAAQEKLPEKSIEPAQFLINLILSDDLESGSYSIDRYNFNFRDCPDEVANSVTIDVRSFGNVEDNVLETLSSDCSLICETILKKDSMKKLTGILLTELLCLAEKNCSSHVNVGSKLLAHLDLKEREKLRKFIGLELLSGLGKDGSILEDIGAMDDPVKMLDFLELILRKQVLESESSAREGEEYEFAQSLLFSLTILSALCEAKRGGTSSGALVGEDWKFEWDYLLRFIPHLQKLCSSAQVALATSGVPELAENIMIIIETKGVGGGQKEKVKPVSRFEDAMKNLGNPMLPMKGHALLELRKLVEENDPDAMKNDKLLVQIFQREMRNDDSYVYLMAIRGMAALALKFHSSVVPCLIKEYGGSEGAYSKKFESAMKCQERSEFCMKMGEVLVSVIKNLGEIARNYKSLLTNVFFHRIRDEDPLIRASALSNLGELCHLLKFELGTILTEVWYSIENLLQVEKHVEVRRAGLHLIVLLLRGVEKDLGASDILLNEDYGRHLRDVRRLIARLHDIETDMVSKIHCQLALKEIDLIVKKLLLPSDKLEYKIRVLDRF